MAYTVPFDIPTWSYERALEELHIALRFGIEPLLETVEDMLAELGDPDLAFASVQIAGTNGKTSTSRYTAAILAGEGLRTALYTSPELVRYNERIEIDGAPVSDGQFARGIAAAKVAGERVNARRTAEGKKPYDVTEFDTLTVAACVIFAEAGVDMAVLEVGMGGRWDATTAVKSIRAVAVTGIGLDHTRILGSTLEEIASEKAAVIKPGFTCVLGEGVKKPASVEDVFLARCHEVGVTPVRVRYDVEQAAGTLGGELGVGVTTAHGNYAHLRALKPTYQAPNIALATTLAESFLARGLDEDALRAAIATCPTPGRFDVVRTEPLVLIDACHNPQSVEVFLGSVREVFPVREERPVLLAAVLADKDVAGIVGLLAEEFPRVCVTQTTSPRALPAPELATLFVEKGAQIVGTFSSVGAALEALDHDPVIACGSITLAGEVAGILRQ